MRLQLDTRFKSFAFVRLALRVCLSSSMGGGLWLSVMGSYTYMAWDRVEIVELEVVIAALFYFVFLLSVLLIDCQIAV